MWANADHFISASLDRRQRGYAWLYLAYLKGQACEPDGRGVPKARGIRDTLWLLVPDKDGSAIRFHDEPQYELTIDGLLALKGEQNGR